MQVFVVDNEANQMIGKTVSQRCCYNTPQSLDIGWSEAKSRVESLVQAEGQIGL